MSFTTNSFYYLIEIILIWGACGAWAKVLKIQSTDKVLSFADRKITSRIPENPYVRFNASVARQGCERNGLVRELPGLRCSGNGGCECRVGLNCHRCHLLLNISKLTSSNVPAMIVSPKINKTVIIKRMTMSTNNVQLCMARLNTRRRRTSVSDAHKASAAALRRVLNDWLRYRASCS